LAGKKARFSREKEDAFAGKLRGYVFKRCFAHDAHACKREYSPLLLLLECDTNGNLRASHGG
jgi:hypothetical protein